MKTKDLSNIGEAYFDHYEKYLGKPVDNIVFEDDKLGWKIQVLVFSNVFENCVTFATMGLSHFSNEVGSIGELVFVADSSEKYIPEIVFNTVKTIVLSKMRLGWGMGIAGTEKISSKFVAETGKDSIYIAKPMPFPESFSTLDLPENGGTPKVYLGIFVSSPEYKLFCESGAEKFEEYLEFNQIDPFNLKRK